MKYILELDTNNNVSIYPDENDLVIIDDIKFKELTEQEYKQAMNKVKDGYYPKWNGTLIFEKVVANYYVDKEKLDTPIYKNLMEQEGVYTDYANYRVAQLQFEKEQRAREKAKQEAYELALKTNPDLTWEDFLKTYPAPMVANVEPTIPDTVKKFMEDYL